MNLMLGPGICPGPYVKAVLQFFCCSTGKWYGCDDFKASQVQFPHISKHEELPLRKILYQPLPQCKSVSCCKVARASKSHYLSPYVLDLHSYFPKSLKNLTNKHSRSAWISVYYPAHYVQSLSCIGNSKGNKLAGGIEVAFAGESCTFQLY